jgi:hypothetical protein
VARLPILFPLLLLAGCTPVQLAPPAAMPQSGRLVDVHYHAPFAGRGSATIRDQIVEEMDRDQVAAAVIAIADYEDVALYEGPFDHRFVSGAMLGCPRNSQAPEYWCFPSDDGWAGLAWLEQAIRSGRIEAIHEVLPNYNGIPVSDPRYAPYFALAAKYDIPVGIHSQRGPGPTNPPRSNPGCCPAYHLEAGNPAHLRAVLDHHPRLRVWIEHVGAGAQTEPPHWDETLALLRDYPSVHLDMAITNSLAPASVHEAALKRVIDAGFGDRIMFGSDNMPVAEAEKRLNEIAWLTDAQRTAIRRGNAIRFFRLGQR